MAHDGILYIAPVFVPYHVASYCLEAHEKGSIAVLLDLQKASSLKRFSAYLLDMILLCVLVTGVALILSVVFGFDGYVGTFESGYASYEEQYGVDFDIAEEDYLALSESDREHFDAAYKAFSEDKDVVYAYNMMINLALVILGYAVLEFILPLVFGNGQTVGKKIFAIGIMQQSHVAISPVILFVRTILGKCTIGTMVPMLIILMIFTGSLGIVGTGVLLVLLILQIALMITTKTNSTIHDVLASTVAVDLASQMIFATDSELLEYKKRRAEEAASNARY